MPAGTISFAFGPGDAVYVIDKTPCSSGCSNCNCGTSCGSTPTVVAIRRGIIVELQTTQLTTSVTPNVVYTVRFGDSAGSKNFDASVLYDASGAGPITSLGPVIGGALYVDGVYTNVPLSGGSGTGAVATITVVGGAVVGVVITNPGMNYLPTNILTTPNSNLGGTGGGFSVPVATTNSTGLAAALAAYSVLVA